MRVTEQSSFRGSEAQRLADQSPAQASRTSRKLPSAPRERKPALAAIAVLLIVGGALLTGLLVLKMGDRVSAIKIKSVVGAGQQIPQAALEEVQIPADTEIPYVGWEFAGEAITRYAKVDLVPGTLLNKDMTTDTSNALTPGKAVVGLSLKAGQTPGLLSAGQRVQVIYVPGQDGEVTGGKVLAERAVVNSVSNGGSTGSGTLMVDIVIDKGSAATISAYASAGRIALAYLPGVKDGQQPAPTASPSATPEPTDTTPVEPTAVPTGKTSKKGTPSPTATTGG
ncbi:hypothetical protein ACIBG8_23735 [Nonomuraea sp. NPDC050556]|uniref:hypothetical protein n=1 Tax=Nonomuraea sp. NPDC050556 TaxID=3364369 RepID=UPI003793143F